MNSLEQYLKNDCNNNFVIFNNLDYTYFGYENDDEMEFDLEFLIETIFPEYQIIYDEDENIKKLIKESRPNQTTFRQKLIQKYGEKCIITGGECLDELEACHIVPHSEDKHNSLVTNGLLLKATLHKTFDKYKWVINPDTLMIEVKHNGNIGDIREYEGMKVNLDPNDIILINNLKKRYEYYLEN